MMKLGILALVSALALTTAAHAQDRYYARHQLMRANSSGAATVPPATGQNGTWSAGSFGAWDSACSTSAMRTRPVTCEVNGSAVGDGQCNAADRPSATELSSVSTGCDDALSNGSFESGLAGWSNSSASAPHASPHVISGSNIARLDATGGNISQTLAGLKAGTRYRATIYGWMYHGDGRSHTLQISAGGVSNQISTSDQHRFLELSVDFVYQPGATVRVDALNEAWWLDGAMIRPIG